MMRVWSRWMAVALATLGLMPKALAQDDAKPHWVAHGQEISATKVGPRALGIGALKTFAGGEIKARKDYPFGTWIDKAVSYDGFAVPAGHLLIEGIAFSSSLDVSAPFPVVLRGVTVRLAKGSPWGILMRPSSAGLYVLWSEAGGASSAVAPGEKPVDVALDLRGAPAGVYHSHFSNAVDGVHVSGGDTRIEQSLIDDLIAVPESHNDGIQLLGAPTNVRIHKNRIINRNPQTSCVYLLGRKLTVSSNYLSGGGWSVYAGANNNGHGGEPGGPLSLTDNVFRRGASGKSGHFGPVAYWDKHRASSGDWSNNRFDDGAAINP